MARPVHGVAIIGCGNMGMSHGRAVQHSSRCRVVATIDRRGEAATAAHRSLGADFHSADYHDVLERPDIGVAVVATYPSSHREIAVACLNAGKHVLLEKPIAGSTAEAEDIVCAALRGGRKLRVGYVLRHNRTYRRAAALIQKGSLGFPLAMRMMGGEHIITEAHWQQDLALLTDTSPIIDCGCHYVDVMRWVTGAEAARVSGVGCRLDPAIPVGCYDYGAITVTFSDGSTGLYEVGWTRAYRSFSEKEFIGPQGRLRIVYAGERAEHQDKGDLIELYQPPRPPRHVNVPEEFKPLGRQLTDLLDCIDGDLDPKPALEDAMRSLQIVLAGDRAIRTGATQAVKPWRWPQRP